MSKKGGYFGGHTIIRAKVADSASSSYRALQKKRVRALRNEFAAYVLTCAEAGVAPTAPPGELREEIARSTSINAWAHRYASSVIGESPITPSPKPSSLLKGREGLEAATEMALERLKTKEVLKVAVIVAKVPNLPAKKEANRSSQSGKTTTPGYVNRNSQIVVRRTSLPGNDHMQITYVLRCQKCRHEYGANGSDIWQRRCPRCGRGATGLPIAE